MTSVEMQLTHGDDIPVAVSSLADIDLEHFRRFFRSRFEQEFEDHNLSLAHLPNNLTVANIRSGTSNIRNSFLASFATKILPLQGSWNRYPSGVEGISVDQLRR